MRKYLLTRCSLAALSVGGMALPAQAQQTTTTSVITTPVQTGPKLSWAESTFSELSMQFGTVPKGANVVKTVTVTNPFKEDLQITNIGTSCGCFQASTPKKLLKTHETTVISVSMNTIKFSGDRNANLDVTMTFNGRDYKSVRVPLKGFIRTDFEINPPAVNLATVEQGRGTTRSVILRTMRPGMKVTGVRATNPLVKAEVRERAGYGASEFEISVSLDSSAPLGEVRDLLSIRTNDPSTPELQVEVSGKVEPDLVITPQQLTLGNMRPGVPVTKSIIIRGQRPFVIEKLERDTELDVWKSKYSRDSKNLHTINLTMTPPDAPGEYSEVFTISIPGRPEPIKVKAVGTIISAAPSSTATSQAKVD
ncbi:hypothetical protein Pan44_15880 [Caulifigura coniformis]|uniref:DUF1573 domain-containing protein n=1 Tax=Caulifigura coniformis TaxID=2527983 RepID=A0A517SBU9_9PLAN|nr:DUF1573 domain-containing protein [Caulifigura coniformis]QDT53566.1 hypothetical protein Pan44_15880 [Caulifigura coniformis]